MEPAFNHEKESASISSDATVALNGTRFLSWARNHGKNSVLPTARQENVEPPRPHKLESRTAHVAIRDFAFYIIEKSASAAGCATQAMAAALATSRAEIPLRQVVVVARAGVSPASAWAAICASTRVGAPAQPVQIVQDGFTARVGFSWNDHHR